jgi:hypothetical protein
LQDPPKFPQIGIFGLKTNHLATLHSADKGFAAVGGTKNGRLSAALTLKRFQPYVEIVRS